MHFRIRTWVFQSGFCRDCLSLYVSAAPGVSRSQPVWPGCDRTLRKLLQRLLVTSLFERHCGRTSWVCLPRGSAAPYSNGRANNILKVDTKPNKKLNFLKKEIKLKNDNSYSIMKNNANKEKRIIRSCDRSGESSHTCIATQI